ncbi:hypothetical protein Hanom_Chr14g01306281 [Helianthus anomalus]
MISPSMFSESIAGTLLITSFIRLLAAIASEKYFTLDIADPNDLHLRIQMKCLQCCSSWCW